MTKETINRILQINKEFYESVALEFDVTRQYAWEGWEYVIEEVNEEFGDKSIRILDLGCGNGRFYKFIKNEYRGTCEYIGVDNNEKLLELAYKELGEKDNVRFLLGDVIKTGLGKKETYQNSKYDLIVAFGIAHHIPDKYLRLNWVLEQAKLLEAGGLLAIAFWNYNKDKRFKPIVMEEKTVKDLEDGDYFITWNNKQIRYMHIYDEQEHENINKALEKNNIKLVKSFEADGKHKLNKYCVFKNNALTTSKNTIL